MHPRERVHFYVAKHTTKRFSGPFFVVENLRSVMRQALPAILERYEKRSKKNPVYSVFALLKD